jgi:hypothetical protein
MVSKCGAQGQKCTLEAICFSRRRIRWTTGVVATTQGLADASELSSGETLRPHPKEEILNG